MGLFKKKRVQSMDSMLNGVNLPVMDKPQSVIAEQFKTIKTNINFMGIDKSMKTVAFISANISEGKSTVSANVAVASALEGKRVLMIDADFRRPTLHSTFNVSNRVGLTNLLTDDTWRQDVATMVQATRIPNLEVLTVGNAGSTVVKALSSQRMHDVVEMFKNQYDLVVLDVPPILEVTDTQIVASMLDGVVLVVRAGSTPKAAVRRTVEMLEISKANLLGYVLNDVSAADDDGYGYGYGYGYGEE